MGRFTLELPESWVLLAHLRLHLNVVILIACLRETGPRLGLCGILAELALDSEGVHLFDQVIDLALHRLEDLHLALPLLELARRQIQLWLRNNNNARHLHVSSFLFCSGPLLLLDQVLDDKLIELVILRGVQALYLLKYLGTEGVYHGELLLTLVRIGLRG